MAKVNSSTLQLCAIATFAFVAQGCGGAASVAGYLAAVPPPTHMVENLNTMVPFISDTIYLMDCEAVRGGPVYVEFDQNNRQFVWHGSHKFTLNSKLEHPNLSQANGEVAIGECVGPHAYEQFIWPYLSDGPIVQLPNCVNLAVAKNANVFFDQEQVNPAANAPIYLLTVDGTRVKRTPYQLPPGLNIETLSGELINRNGLALARPNFYKPGMPHQSVSGAFEHDRFSDLSWRLQRNESKITSKYDIPSSSSRGSGFMLLSTSSQPVELQIPDGAYYMWPMSLGDQGITVGYAYYVDVNSFSYFVDRPYYWDRQGNPHPLQLPEGVTQGMARDINASGTVVGDAYVPGPGFGVMWPNLESAPISLNSLLPINSPYNVNVANSISNDCSMCTLSYPTGKYSDGALVWLGLQVTSASNGMK